MMNIVQANGSYKAPTVVSLLQYPSAEISSSNMIQLTEGENSILTMTNSLSDSIYLTSNESIAPLESAPIQFVVIQQADSMQTQQPSEDKTVTSKATGQDKLVCGQCEKMCLNVLEFLYHKASHMARGLGQGCEVCSLTFSRTKSLVNHYRRKHKIYIEPDSKSSLLKDNKKTPRKLQSDLTSSNKPTCETDNEQPDFKNIDTKNCMAGCEVSSDNSQTINAGESAKTSSKETMNVNLLEKQAHRELDSAPDTLITEDYSTENMHDECMKVQSGLITGTQSISEEEKNVTFESNSDKETGVAVQNVPGLESDIADTSQLKNNSAESKLDTRILIDNTQNGSHEKDDISLYRPKDISSIPSCFKPDFVVEIDMPDFYFIAIIERGPRNSINGSKYHFQCLYCDLKLSWRNTMCQHMKERHPNILKAVPTLDIPKQHLDKKHKIIKMSEYIKLEKNTKKNKRMRGIETQDLPGNFPCRKCGKVFSCLRYFRRHEYLHQAEKNLLCSICVKSFKTLANLNQHMKSHKEREAYKCKQCDFESTVNIAIHAHRQIHKDGCALCDICGQAYNDKSTLNKHKKVHDSSRPFACSFPGCTWRFKTKTMCAAHEKAHTTKGKFECKICGYAFRQKHHLQRHETKVHNVTTENKKCTYTVLPVDYIDEGIIVTDSTKLVGMEPKPVQSEVSLIINDTNEVSVDEQFDLESALQTGQLVIATDNTGNTINYEMTDMGMSVSYQTLLPDTDGQHLDTQTVIIPQTDENQIMYQHEEVTETVCTEVSTS